MHTSKIGSSGGGVSTQRYDHEHPEYRDNLVFWNKCRDTYNGEEAVKKNSSYLPYLTGMSDEEYHAYRERAVYLNTMRRTVHGMAGAAMRKLPAVNLPEAILDYVEDIDLRGTTLYEFIHKVLTETLITGRCVIVVDRHYNGRAYLSLYNAESFINWRVEDGISVMATFVENLDYSEDGWSHEEKIQYRIFDINDSGFVNIRVAEEYLPENDTPGGFKILSEVLPSVRGEPMSKLPVVAVNTMGSSYLDVDRPPLLDLTNLSLAHYRASSDLEHGRHFTALPQGWITGVDPDDHSSGIVIGSSSAWLIPNEGARVGYLEFTGAGLGSLENSLKEKESMMAIVGARLLEGGKRGVESADETKVRQNIETSVLSNVVMSVQNGITKALKYLVDWEGGDTGEVSVEMNMDFVNVRLPHQEIIALVQAYQMGGLSMDTLLYNLKQGEVIPHDVSIEDERDKIELEHGALSNIPEGQKFNEVQEQPEVITEADKNINPNGDAS